MPRVARTKSSSGLYHIIMRGINRQTVFEDEEDFKKFVETMEKYKEVCEYQIYAYCLMSNHLHLLIKEGKEPLETVMRRICGSYVFWYNKKYERIGNLFQDRYKSEPIEGTCYLLTVVRYIFYNPIKAGIVDKIQNYPWTNYRDYMEGNYNAEIDFILNIFHTDRKKAMKQFVVYLNENNDDMCLDIIDNHRLTDCEANEAIKAKYKIDNATEIQKFEKAKRNICLKDLRRRYGLTIRQIERLTGISRGIIQRI